MIYRNQDHGNEIGHYAQIIHPKWCCIDFDVWGMKGIGNLQRLLSQTLRVAF